MKCPDCKNEMIWQNDWDLSDEREPEQPNMLTMYCCVNEKCNIESVEINRKVDI